MKILVCIKPVPESEAPVRIAPDGKSIQTDPLSPLRMNRYDEQALEEALLIRDTFPDTRIEAISVGPKRSETVLKRALGMGADHGIHICTDIENDPVPAVVAAWVAAAARSRNYDLILSGMMSEDGLHGQVGPLVAEHLSLPCVTAVVGIRITPGKATASVQRVPAEGLRDLLALSLPAVLTIQSGAQKPRYPSLSNILRAKGQDLEIIAAASLSRPESFQQAVRFKYPQKTRFGRFLEGSPQQKAQELLSKLKEKSFLA
ncbi:MAG: electron transfer flavoprotein subunit beta/FixA family protein [Desulfobacterales bacterium]|nr:electron transfer flavoprotein subunit beta/FixA family protein [Desulfobacterales bacterium]